MSVVVGGGKQGCCEVLQSEGASGHHSQAALRCLWPQPWDKEADSGGAREAERVMRDSRHQTQAMSLGLFLVSRSVLVSSWSSLSPLIQTLGCWMFITCRKQVICSAIFVPVAWSNSRRTRKPGPALALTQPAILFPHRQKGNQDVVLPRCLWVHE